MKFIRHIVALLALFPLLAGAQTLQQTAGIYYAYPGPLMPQTQAPAGYKPFYISHYGRHGSRWITEDKRYTDVLEYFADTTKLTPLGRDVGRRLQLVTDDALGRSGSLSPVGEKQHREIAARMYTAFPEVFADTSTISAVSSTSGRCIMSMCSFIESLKENNPRLVINKSAYERDMEYIAYVSDEGKVFSAKDASWRRDYRDFVDEMVKPARLIESLFLAPEVLTASQQRDIATGLYWIASDMQDVEIDEDFYDIFTYDELKNMWRCINARMYVCNGNAPIAEGVMKKCASHLLANIVDNADKAVAGNGVSANLRFGHDTHLLRLLTLMGINGCTNSETDMHSMHEAWQDYRLSPMAANLQMIFYRNDSDDVLVKLMLNENEVRVPVETYYGNYYSWPVLRDYLINLYE